ncbi:ATP-binding cassette domain-containing protein [Thiomicrospira sp. R3]|uniref:ABC transporter ATP-binding protein n=1 Tax=Thiomicrospira sp. R3 TaxID=3035472 RepID=UPI00259B7C95|nr:ATP-binding cassette domain-containing protein [Thiomicrospira sp. R3]WFE68892.1 ATP-binding cassette domain-containing protein [Thiomicrospira sp. R3]
MSKLIQIENVSFSRGGRKIFDDLTLSIPRGKVTAIMGPSGTGKTTLLKLIAGQLKPESGKILVDGLDVNQLKRTDLYRLRQRMGMLFQSGALLTDLTVFDNVAFPLREHFDLSDLLIEKMVWMKLESVGLRGAVALKPAELSGGMARRVALARALILDPEMLFYDEPFAGQDPITMGVLVALIKKMNQSLDLTSVVVSHDVGEVMSIADYACVLSEGRIIAQGTPEDLQQSESAYVQQFLQGLADGPVPLHYPVESWSEKLAQPSGGQK